MRKNKSSQSSADCGPKHVGKYTLLYYTSTVGRIPGGIDVKATSISIVSIS